MKSITQRLPFRKNSGCVNINFAQLLRLNQIILHSKVTATRPLFKK